MMRLINAPPSPFGRKVAIALHEKALPFETQWDEPWGEATVTGDYNPLAQLPILITDQGDVLYESNYLLEWIERRYPDPPLLPADDDGILAVKRLMVLADGILSSASTIIRELTRPPSSAAWLARYRDKITRASEALDAAIGDADFVHRDRFGQGDIAIGVNLKMIDTMTDLFGQQIELEPWHQRLPRLARYVARLDERPSFVATRPQPMPFDHEKVYG
jgi:glutathione S-transferase